METVAVILGVLLVGGLVFFVYSVITSLLDVQRKHEAAVNELAGFLGGKDACGSPTGAPYGLPITYCIGGAYDYLWTKLPPSIPFQLHIRPEGPPHPMQVPCYEVVDLVVGCESFDAAYIIEGAPAEVVRALLTPERCARLAALGRFLLSTEKDTTPQLNLQIYNSPRGLKQAQEAMQLLTELANGVRDAYAAADAALPKPMVGAPFREHQDDSAVQRAAEQRLREVQQLEEKRIMKPEAGLYFLVSFIVVTALSFLIWAATSS